MDDLDDELEPDQISHYNREKKHQDVYSNTFMLGFCAIFSSLDITTDWLYFLNLEKDNVYRKWYIYALFVPPMYATVNFFWHFFRYTIEGRFRCFRNRNACCYAFLVYILEAIFIGIMYVQFLLLLITGGSYFSTFQELYADQIRYVMNMHGSSTSELYGETMHFDTIFWQILMTVLLSPWAITVLLFFLYALTGILGSLFCIFGMQSINGFVKFIFQSIPIIIFSVPMYVIAFMLKVVDAYEKKLKNHIEKRTYIKFDKEKETHQIFKSKVSMFLVLLEIETAPSIFLLYLNESSKSQSINEWSYDS